MNTLRPLTIVAFVLLLAFFLADRSGLITEVNNIVHEKDGWEKVEGGYLKTEIETMNIVNVSLLKDPKTTSFNIYRGAMKKSAVDRMELVTTVSIELSNENIHKLSREIADQAKMYKCNTAIVNAEMILHRAKSQALGM